MWFDNYPVFEDIKQRLALDRFAPYRAVRFAFRDYEPELLYSEPKSFPFNLTSLVGRSPNLGLGNVIHSLGLLDDVLKFQMDGIYDRRDQQSFVDWIIERKIDPVFRDVFLLPAAHVTLNRESAPSAAEMVLYQHLCYTSHPWAFDRTITTEDFATAAIDPWADALRRLGVAIRTEAPVPGLARILGGSTSDGPSARAMGRVRERLGGFEIAPPYKVLRLWTDRLVDLSRPGVLETPEHSPLALVAQFHRLETESLLWSEGTPGSVIELHLYSRDDATAALTDDEVWPFVGPIVLELWPELADHRILGRTVGSYENFTSFAVGQGSRRPLPGGLTDLFPNLLVAGDWVHTTTPSALMERSVLTGRLAANTCRFADGVREVGYDHPPMTGPLLSKRRRRSLRRDLAARPARANRGHLTEPPAAARCGDVGVHVGGASCTLTPHHESGWIRLPAAA